MTATNHHQKASGSVQTTIDGGVLSPFDCWVCEDTREALSTGIHCFACDTEAEDDAASQDSAPSQH